MENPDLPTVMRAIRKIVERDALKTKPHRKRIASLGKVRKIPRYQNRKLENVPEKKAIERTAFSKTRPPWSPY